MTAPDERVWLTHPEHGGYFHAPAGAVEVWVDMGWVVADTGPEEHNPVIAEQLAWRAEQAAQAEAAAASAKTSRKSGTNTTPQEG
jgi:hypothetical protein